LPTELETARLRLRHFRAADLDSYAALCADPEVMRYVGDRGVLRREDALAADGHAGGSLATARLRDVGGRGTHHRGPPWSTDFTAWALGNTFTNNAGGAVCGS
jgi:hypothetical protein